MSKLCEPRFPLNIRRCVSGSAPERREEKYAARLRSRRHLALLMVILTFAFMMPVNAADAVTIAVVNGQRISANELEFLYLSRRIPKDQQAEVRHRFVEDLVDRALLKQFLDKRKVEFSRELLDQQVARIESVIKADGKNVNEVLRSVGYTRETLRSELVTPLRWRAHASAVITDAALQAYWEMHRQEYDGTEVRAAQIVKKLPADSSSHDSETAKQVLAVVRTKILSKELTFADAAKQHSDSPTSKEGGDLGTFGYRGRMPIEITQVAFKLKVGEVSEPFQTQFGVHLLTVAEIIPGDLSLEDVRLELFDAIANEMQRRLLKELRATAKIERK